MLNEHYGYCKKIYKNMKLWIGWAYSFYVKNNFISSDNEIKIVLELKKILSLTFCCCSYLVYKLNLCSQKIRGICRLH